MRKRQTKTRKNRKKRFIIAVSVILSAVLLGSGVWLGFRLTENIQCTHYSGAEFTDDGHAAVRAVAFSYLVYGLETCQPQAGQSVAALIETNDMGILRTNDGIYREKAEDPATARIDTAAFITENVGTYRLLADRQDADSSFYGAAFCEDTARNIWIAYSGSCSLRDAWSAVALVAAPRLSAQEREAFALYETVMASDEVQKQGYSVCLTGHSLGGALAALVAGASGCRALTVNGADGAVAGKLRTVKIGGVHSPRDVRYLNITNYITDLEGQSISFLNGVQRLISFGDQTLYDTHYVAPNGETTDCHCAFSYIRFHGENHTDPYVEENE